MLKTTTGAAKSFGMHDSAPSVGRSPSLEHMGWFQIPERSRRSPENALVKYAHTPYQVVAVVLA
jgi:hypothetical protein